MRKGEFPAMMACWLGPAIIAILAALLFPLFVWLRHH